MTSYVTSLYRKYHPIAAVLLYLCLWAGLIYWIDAAKLSIPIELWDNVATIGWSLLPFGIGWALCAFALNLREYRSKTAADTALVLENVEHQRIYNDAQRLYNSGAQQG